MLRKNGAGYSGYGTFLNFPYKPLHESKFSNLPSQPSRPFQQIFSLNLCMIGESPLWTFGSERSCDRSRP